MLNIIIPMAGLGSRFRDAGYKMPKPFINIHNIPMIKLVINNLTPQEDHRFIFICQKEHLEYYHFQYHLKSWAKDCQIIYLDTLTQGAACTVLAAAQYINEEPLMIANCDQYINFDINIYLESMKQKNLDGFIMTMKAQDPKWSFVKLNDQFLVEQVAEKQVISDEATIGIYNFTHGLDFLQAAKAMIDKNTRVNNEFYVAPVYNEMIQNNKKIGIYNIGHEGEVMYGLGTPDDLSFFIKNKISLQALTGLV